LERLKKSLLNFIDGGGTWAFIQLRQWASGFGDLIGGRRAGFMAWGNLLGVGVRVSRFSRRVLAGFSLMG
jgi:hypothetical protein